MERFLETARQDSAYLRADRRLDQADRRYRQVLGFLSPADRKAIENYLRAGDALADTTAAIAFFMGQSERRRQKRRDYWEDPAHDREHRMYKRLLSLKK